MPDARSPAGPSFLAHVVVCVSVVALTACSESAPTAIGVEPQFAPGGGGPPVRVDATDPTGAEQGMTLDVRVLGSNFEPGSNARFELDGVPGNVTTNSTTFISPDELVANITVDAAAEIGLYDVEVITPRGKKGVGTELFEVRVQGGGPPAFPSASVSVRLRDASGDAVASDGGGPYEDNVDGVRAFVYLGPDEGFEGQIHLNTDWDESDPAFRTLQMDLRSAAGSDIVFQGALPVRFMINGSELDAFNALAAGESLSYRMHFQFEDETGSYDLRFGSECGGQGERPAERVLVTLLESAPKVWDFTHHGNALLCVVPARSRGKPAARYSVTVAAPFGMIIAEAN